MLTIRPFILGLLLSSLSLTISSCAALGGGGVGSPVAGNENGSAPTNENEVNEYKRAVHKCYKTGGSRVVKINGKLRCYD